MNVLYWGYRPNAPVPYFRAGMFRPHLEQHGITAVYLSLADLALEAIEWADVVVFRGWYREDSGVTELAWAQASGKARVYDSDDWDLSRQPHDPHYAEIRDRSHLVRQMAREADVMTTATPELARRYAAYRSVPPIVVRNAVDPALYVPDRPPVDKPTMALFYGANSRLNDYFGFIDPQGRRHPGHAAAAVAAAGVDSMWIGCEGEIAPSVFKHVVPYDHDMLRFFHTLGNVRADIGIAPLAETDFNACKSELHWLDMTAASVPVVAQRFMGDGPYGVIRDGVDGLLVRGAREWHDAVSRLAKEPALRADLVGAARERIAIDYDPARRAAEWVSVFDAALHRSPVLERSH